jgi:formylmethanofuran dehydrogenase subunit E
MNDILRSLASFHGHLGPYAVIGYRMGRIACDRLGEDPFEKNVLVSTGTTPPLSCIIDGIQVGSGCTLGKGNVTVDHKDQAQAVFSNKKGKNVKITLKDIIREEIDTKVNQDNIISYSEEIFERPDESLFDIEYYE